MRARSFSAFREIAGLFDPELAKRRNSNLLSRYSAAICGVMAKPYSSAGAFTHHLLMPGFFGRKCCATSDAALRRWSVGTVVSWAMLNKPSSVASLRWPGGSGRGPVDSAFRRLRAEDLTALAPTDRALPADKNCRAIAMRMSAGSAGSLARISAS